jgi:hypothetical protein
VYVTEDKAMYKAAMFWEGTAKQFDLAWQRDYFKGKRSQIIEWLRPSRVEAWR